MKKINNLAFLDVETTGGSPIKNRIIEIAIITVGSDGFVQKTYNTRVNPQINIPNYIIQLTGISNTDVIDCPVFKDILPKIASLLKNKTIIAHNAKFDYGFLKNEFARNNKKLKNKVACTVKLSRLLYPQFKRHNLTEIIKRHNIIVSHRHSALGDTQATYDFFYKAVDSISKDKFLEAFKKSHEKLYIPKSISFKAIQKIPNTYGVYIIYGKDNIPIYVGKSNAGQTRIKQHFQATFKSNTEMQIANQCKKINFKICAGELSALILEQKLIYELKPILNKKQRKSKILVCVVGKKNKEGYITLTTKRKNIIKPADFKNIYAMFKSVKQAKDYLVMLAREFNLCDKLLGLEKCKNDCFGFKIARCNGACIGKESVLAYNKKLNLSFEDLKFVQWSFKNAIAIKQENLKYNKVEYLVINYWCHMGTVKNLPNTGAVSIPKSTFSFDYGMYKILKSYLNKKNVEIITNIKTI